MRFITTQAEFVATNAAVNGMVGLSDSLLLKKLCERCRVPTELSELLAKYEEWKKTTGENTYQMPDGILFGIEPETGDIFFEIPPEQYIKMMEDAGEGLKYFAPIIGRTFDFLITVVGQFTGLKAAWETAIGAWKQKQYLNGYENQIESLDDRLELSGRYAFEVGQDGFSSTGRLYYIPKTHIEDSRQGVGASITVVGRGRKNWLEVSNITEAERTRIIEFVRYRGVTQVRFMEE